MNNVRDVWRNNVKNAVTVHEYISCRDAENAEVAKGTTNENLKIRKGTKGRKER
jgi:hypothetical protein